MKKRLPGKKRLEVSSLDLVCKASLGPLLHQFSAEKNTTPGHVALVWLFAQTTWIVSIPDTTQAPSA